MPNRFRPTVLPDYTPDRRPGEELARGIEAFEAARDRKAHRERLDRADARAEEEHGRASVERDLRFDEFLTDRGLAPALPRDVEEGRRVREEREPDFGERDVFAPRRAEIGEEIQGGPGIGLPELDPRDIRGAFSDVAGAGPEGLDRPLLLPGQFRPGHGFSQRPVYLDDVPDVRARERLREPSRVTAGGREFEKVGPTREERASRAQGEEMRRIMEGLVEAGVPADRAEFAARDPALARQFLGPEEEEAPRITREQLIALGVSEELADAGATDPSTARTIIAEQLRSRRPRAGTGGGPRVTAEQLVGLGIDPELAELGAIDQVLGRQLINEARGAATPDLPPAVRERRSGIVSTLGGRLTEPWQQQIADRLAGVGPDGRVSDPMSAEEILAGFERAGTNPADLNRVRRFLRPMLTAARR